MSFAQDTGYTPATFAELMATLMAGINTQFGTTFTDESFVGTNWYKYLYGPVQKILENEVKTSEVFSSLQAYITTTNERIQRPSVSLPGLIESFESQDYVASIKPPAEMEAGTVSICVDVDPDAVDYAATKLEICGLIRDYVAAGMVTEGDETETIVLSNGQAFDFSFFLPDPTPVLLRLTLRSSENTLLLPPTDEAIRLVVYQNVNARYRLGWNFEPQRYYSESDALWAETVLLEWSDDAGANYHSTVFEAAFDDLYTFGLDDIEVLIDP